VVLRVTSGTIMGLFRKNNGRQRAHGNDATQPTGCKGDAKCAGLSAKASFLSYRRRDWQIGSRPREIICRM
jgi:hypothetical protein